MINYNEIIENLRENDVFRLLEQLGAEPVDKGGYFLCRTVCHNEDPDEASQKLYYYKDSHLFYCYTECGGQSIFKFLQHYYEARSIVYDWYSDIFQVILNCSIQTSESNKGYHSKRDNYEPKKVRKELPTYSNGVLNCFSTFYPAEWLGDGITIETMKKYGIKYSISQNKIIIPHYNIHGDLVGIRGRALNEFDIANFGKYAPIQIEEKWYSHPLSLNLYGLNLNQDNIRKTGVAWIGESEKFCMQIESFNVPNCSVACCGSSINKFQVDLLLRYCAPREIVICFDREESTKEDKYFSKLYNMAKKYKNYCNISFIYDRNGITPIKASPSDEGEEKFLQLLAERVKV